MTLNSADCCCIPARRASCFFAIFERVLAEAGQPELLSELLDLVVVSPFAELLLDRPHLLAKDSLALVFPLVGHHRRDFLPHAEELELPLDDVGDGADARLRVERLEDLLLVGDAGLLEREVRSDEVGKGAALADVVEDARRLFREAGHEAEHLAHRLARTRAERVELGVALEVLVDALHLRPHVRLEPERLHHLQAREAVEDDRIIRWTEANDLHDPRDGSHLEEVAETGLVYVGVPLADDADDRAVLAEQILDEADAARRDPR